VTGSLGSLGDSGADLSSAAESLRTLLRDADERIRRDAILPARRVPALASDVRALLTDADAGVRCQAAAAVLDASAGDADARRVLFTVLAHAEDDSGPRDADWTLVGGVLESIPLTADDAPVLAAALRAIDDCWPQGHLLKALTRLGPASAPALTAERLALAGELPCDYGMHAEPPNRPEAIAALAAMGAAAAPAVPDLRNLAADEPSLAASARAAVDRIEGRSR
jgi:hypothetical protein